MILVDGNILIYATVSAVPQHALSRSWLNERLNGSTCVGLPWTSLLAFWRIATNPRIMARPLSAKSAWYQVTNWLSSEVDWIHEPTARHREIMESLLLQPDIRGKLIPDAHLAALAIEHGLTMCSADTDFARFKGLRWENPLAQ